MFIPARLYPPITLTHLVWRNKKCPKKSAAFHRRQAGLYRRAGLEDTPSENLRDSGGRSGGVSSPRGALRLPEGGEEPPTAFGDGSGGGGSRQVQKKGSFECATIWKFLSAADRGGWIFVYNVLETYCFICDTGLAFEARGEGIIPPLLVPYEIS